MFVLPESTRRVQDRKDHDKDDLDLIRDWDLTIKIMGCLMAQPYKATQLSGSSDFVQFTHTATEEDLVDPLTNTHSGVSQKVFDVATVHLSEGLS